MADLLVTDEKLSSRETFRIDNFALTTHQACPAKYQLRIVDHWEPRTKGAALGYGAAVHAGLAKWYEGRPLIEALEAIRLAWPASHPPDDFRTVTKAQELLMKYVREYPSESFKVVRVETAFTLDLGRTTELGTPIEYGGIFDTLVDFNGMLYVLEHKTTSELGNYYFHQYNPNNQVTGYVWAASILSGRKVGGAIINALCTTKGGNIKFERQITNRSEQDIENWKNDVAAECSEIERNKIKGFFAKRTINCSQYGGCPYRAVHTLSTEKEQRSRLETEYVRSEWDYEARDVV